jgi:hypothetical protein
MGYSILVCASDTKDVTLKIKSIVTNLTIWIWRVNGINWTRLERRTVWRTMTFQMCSCHIMQVLMYCHLRSLLNKNMFQQSPLVTVALIWSAVIVVQCVLTINSVPTVAQHCPKATVAPIWSEVIVAQQCDQQCDHSHHCCKCSNNGAKVPNAAQQWPWFPMLHMFWPCCVHNIYWERHQLVPMGFKNAACRTCASFLSLAHTRCLSPFLPWAFFPGNSRPLLCRLPSRKHLLEILFGFS